MTTDKAKEIISYHKILVDRDKSGLLDKKLEYEAIDMAIKALEQGAILDKIRAEIIDTGAYEQEVNGKTEFLKGINYCLSIIDKYKAESEDKE